MKFRFWHPLFTTRAKFPIKGNTSLLRSFIMKFGHALLSLDTSFMSKILGPSFFNRFGMDGTIRLAAFKCHVQKIFFLDCYKKMIWINTRRIITMMAYIFANRNRAFVKFKCNLVNHSGYSFSTNGPDKNISISGSIFSASPKPTTRLGFINFFKKSFLDCV